MTKTGKVFPYRKGMYSNNFTYLRSQVYCFQDINNHLCISYISSADVGLSFIPV